MGWRSYYWVSTLPPAVIVVIFKLFLRRFDQQFRYYQPSPQEANEIKLHNARNDVGANRLERKFGHPALHEDLFTPMVHSKMMHLLPQVYHGRLENKRTSMAEYGGQKIEASIAPGGIKIAGIDQASPNLQTFSLKT
jgi:calcium permeable stress-gated cation channel